jgi:SAM-dependent methyltransferase
LQSVAIKHSSLPKNDNKCHRMNADDPIRQKKTDIDNVLPPVADWPAEKLRPFRYTDLDGDLITLAPQEFANRDTFPLPVPIDREGYATLENSDRYWSSGFADWANIQQAIKKHSTLAKQQTIRFLDFGCASGRVLRHALTTSGDSTEVWGCDFAPANFAWINRHLPDSINSIVNTAAAKLPFADDHFDIVSAFSVMTHIDHDEIEWLLELKRITQPNGLLYLTVHNDATWAKVIDRPATLKQIQNQNRFKDNMKIDEEMLRGPIPKERLVFRKGHSDVYNCNVWHSDAYLKRVWGEHFEILQIADCAHSKFQTPVIMRPK